MARKKFYFHNQTPQKVRYVVKGIIYGWLGSWAIGLLLLAFTNYIPAIIFFALGIVLLISSRIVQDEYVKKGYMGYRMVGPKPQKY